MAKISVLGSGSWGMALALLLHNNGHEVLLWSARPEDARKLREKRENPDRLPGVQIPEDIEILTDLERAIKSADVTVLAVASPYIRNTAHKMAPFVRKGQKIVNVAKGIEEKTLKTLSEVIEEEIPEDFGLQNASQKCHIFGRLLFFHVSALSAIVFSSAFGKKEVHKYDARYSQRRS